MHDLFASQYGYSYEQILNLTFRQIHALIDIMSKRTHNEYAMQAAVHGTDITMKEINENIEIKSIELDDLIIKATRDAAKRIMGEKLGIK